LFRENGQILNAREIAGIMSDKRHIQLNSCGCDPCVGRVDPATPPLSCYDNFGPQPGKMTIAGVNWELTKKPAKTGSLAGTPVAF
jgi:hypothetical protein